MTKGRKPRWKKGWPMARGDYLIRLQCGDIVAMQIRPSVGDWQDDEKIGLEASDSMDSVFFVSPDNSPLEDYWGKALAHYGPVPTYRGKLNQDKVS